MALVDFELDAQNSYLFTHNTFTYNTFTYNTFINLTISETFYLKFYHQFSLISNAANYNTVILDNLLFTE